MEVDTPGGKSHPNIDLTIAVPSFPSV